MSDNYFVTMAEVSATLAGLIFVSMSISIKRILEFDHLPARGLVALITIINVLLISSFCLLRQQSLRLLATEVIACWLIVEVFMVTKNWHTHEERMAGPYRQYHLRNMFFSQLSVLSYPVAGMLMLMGLPGAIFWLVPAFTLSIVKALVDAWVLLIEINR
jgi:hypothetical protein